MSGNSAALRACGSRTGPRERWDKLFAIAVVREKPMHEIRVTTFGMLGEFAGDGLGPEPADLQLGIDEISRSVRWQRGAARDDHAGGARSEGE